MTLANHRKTKMFELTLGSACFLQWNQAKICSPCFEGSLLSLSWDSDGHCLCHSCPPLPAGNHSLPAIKQVHFFFLKQANKQASKQLYNTTLLSPWGNSLSRNKNITNIKILHLQHCLYTLLWKMIFLKFCQYHKHTHKPTHTYEVARPSHCNYLKGE